MSKRSLEFNVNNQGELNMITKGIIFLMAAMALAGCAHPMGHFSVLSSRNVNGLDAISSPVGTSRVSAETCRDWILFIPITSRPDLDDALSEIVHKTPGANALSDVTMKRDGLFTFFYNKQCYTIEGTPIKLGK